MAVQRIEADEHVFGARLLVARHATELGFDGRALGELAIVASELASNILKYAGRGHMEVGPLPHAVQGAGIEISASDPGPPFRDLQMALRDGCADDGPIAPPRWFGRKGIGAGLGAVLRFTDSFELDELLLGKTIRVRRFLRRPARPR